MSGERCSSISNACQFERLALETIENPPCARSPELCEEATLCSLSVVSGMSIVGAIKTVATAISITSTTPNLSVRDMNMRHPSKDRFES